MSSGIQTDDLSRAPIAFSTEHVKCLLLLHLLSGQFITNPSVSNGIGNEVQSV